MGPSRSIPRPLAVAAALVLLAPGTLVAQGTPRPAPKPAAAPKFSDIATEFVYASLSFSPGDATQAGLHKYTDPKTRKTIVLDERLDDYSIPALTNRREAYLEFRRRLGRIAKDRLDAQTQADYDVVEAAIDLALFRLDQEQAFRVRPQLYSESLGTALFATISLDYADTVTRAKHLSARLEQAPRFLDQAVANLQASNAIYRRVALESIDGVAALIKGAGEAFVKGTPSEARYQAAEVPALAAIDRYTKYVRDELPKRDEYDWRVGAEQFGGKWRAYLQSSLEPDDVIRAAEDSIRSTRQQMLRLARPLYDTWFPTRPIDDTSPDRLLNDIVGTVLAKIGDEHTHRDSLLQTVQADVVTIGKFVTEHRVLSLDDFSNLRVIPTPPFMRGVYGVAGAVFAPALEPNLATFYWVTPIPAEWPAERAEAKLREYNKYKLLSLTVHEGIPGHIVQGAYANRVAPEWRRLLRAVHGNNPYIEGWAVYMEETTRAAGLNGGDSVKAELVALKAMLRVYANAILDIGLHTKGMTEAQAIDLMMRDAFQERPEAEAKLQRAQLDYVQLNTYFVGLQEWQTLRRDVQRDEGAAFNACRFHDTTLLYGALPMPLVRRLYLDGVAPTASAPPSRCETTTP